MNRNFLEEELFKFASKKRKEINERFFKTGKGEYGEGDIFIGISVPDIRKVTKNNSTLKLEEVQKIIKSKFHEVRLCAILILVEKTKQAIKIGDLKLQKEILDIYIENMKYINNWDLVDLSAHYILGQAIMDGLIDENFLDKLAISDILWERRIAIISTWIMIRNGKFDATLKLSKKLLNDEEDLIHKAVGWMLREVWKNNSKMVEDFLIENYFITPRTTLRYTIERMEEKKRKKFLKGNF